MMTAPNLSVPEPYLMKTIGMHLTKRSLISKRDEAIRAARTVAVGIWRTKGVLGPPITDIGVKIFNMTRRTLRVRGLNPVASDANHDLSLAIYWETSNLPAEHSVDEVTGRRVTLETGARINGFISVDPGKGLPTFRRSFGGTWKPPEKIPAKSWKRPPIFLYAFQESNYEASLESTIEKYWGKP